MKKVNILILGLGGNVSQGILKAITNSNINHRIIGACVNEESLGLYLCERAYISPYASSDQFIQWLIDICNKEEIDIVFTGVEENIIKIAANLDEFNRKTKAIFKCSTYEALKIGQDKLDTSIWLRENGCNYPKFSSTTDIWGITKLIKEVGYPLIAKPRRGKGSNGIFVIKNETELERVLNLNGYILQEYIGDENSEYTVGCYMDKSGKLLNPIIMHRELHYGTTFKAEIIDNDIILKEVKKICNSFRPIGPLNIQLRMGKNDKPVCFELNVRFSGTTPMRAHFGFNDVEAMIEEYIFDRKLPTQFKIKKGMSYRYMNEIYIDKEAQKSLKDDGCIKDMGEFQITVDNTGGIL